MGNPEKKYFKAEKFNSCGKYANAESFVGYPYLRVPVRKVREFCITEDEPALQGVAK